VKVNEHEKAAKAARKVEAMTGFYFHLLVFLVVIVFLVVVNWLASPNAWWVQWV
jgi:hypothetical protein